MTGYRFTPENGTGGSLPAGLRPSGTSRNVAPVLAHGLVSEYNYVDVINQDYIYATSGYRLLNPPAETEITVTPFSQYSWGDLGDDVYYIDFMPFMSQTQNDMTATKYNDGYFICYDISDGEYQIVDSEGRIYTTRNIVPLDVGFSARLAVSTDSGNLQRKYIGEPPTWTVNGTMTYNRPDNLIPWEIGRQGNDKFLTHYQGYSTTPPQRVSPRTAQTREQIVLDDTVPYSTWGISANMGVVAKTYTHHQTATSYIIENYMSGYYTTKNTLIDNGNYGDYTDIKGFNNLVESGFYQTGFLSTAVNQYTVSHLNNPNIEDGAEVFVKWVYVGYLMPHTLRKYRGLTINTSGLAEINFLDY